jgi:FkbH-like protein
MEQVEKSAADGCAVVLEWQDLDPRLGYRLLGGWSRESTSSILAEVEQRLIRLQELIQKVAENVPVAVSGPTLRLPPLFHVPERQCGPDEARLQHALSEFILWASQQANVRVLNQHWLDEFVPAAARFDMKSDLLAGIPHTPAYSDVLAQAIAGLLAPASPKKGLITDLDGTLWKGIVGEIGAGAVSWDLTNHAQVHGLYQQVLQALAEQGVLVGVATKNDAEVVEEAFKRSDLLLKREQIFPLVAGWQPKSEAVQRILRAWNISADDAVFVDDSPMELAEVQAAFPHLECVLFPTSESSKFDKLLYGLRSRFAKERVTREDKLRRQSLQGNDAFEAQTRRAPSYDDFLREAHAELSVEFVSAKVDPRSLELINKTNQFNLNGLRYTQTEWQRHAHQADTFVVSADYKDKYGSLGTISVIKGRQENGTVYIDIWVMSCRAFSRRIEHQCLNVLFDHFKAQEVMLAFTPTPRNEPMRDFLASFSEGKPSGPIKLSKDMFREKCPPLYHRVKANG